MVRIYIVIFLASYYLVFFVLSRFIVPFIGFNKERIPNKIPKDMSKTINRLKKKAKNNKRKYIEYCLNYLSKKHRGHRTLIKININTLFWRDLDKLWNQETFLHCNQMNHLFRIMLRKSELFDAKDIRFKITYVNFSIHQYLQIRVNKKWINADPWGIIVGKRKVGEHSTFIE